jgi:SAM-dependent methyltransferase
MKLTKPSIKKETCEQRHERTKSELSVLHQRYKTMKSENLKNEFQENPELWNKYHAISEENEKSFPEESIPRNCIIQDLDKIKTKRNKLVVDMGCGKAQIADHFANDLRFRFINYDHVSSKENVEVQDISKIPLGENDVEICILCLAMWGSNCEDYIREAYRILESGGNLYIIEATKRWSEKDENGIVIAGQEGNKLKTLLETNGFKIVCEKIEKFSYFKCTK